MCNALKNSTEFSYTFHVTRYTHAGFRRSIRRLPVVYLVIGNR